MKNLKIKILAVSLGSLALLYSCKDKSSNNDESYGPTETSRDATPTENDNATLDTASHETGPGSATIGDTLNKNKK
ncbi:hypothetical protein R1T16_01800 [Flavobacterium sp. DG1-102-2]|uniref:hypothetical protein n=1 Tax=Flavobacterium sp. DG1-102-2 TaxID=3081663 RepID=UPI00294A9692|nr:hypothetical protein [Flavobacterium sp. DG1-102-2]MDV6167139.1 hypothetical protein [Flavobacterium sp. DG1-102-2]